MSIEGAASIFIPGPAASGSAAGPIGLVAGLITSMFLGGKQSGRSAEASAAYEIAPGGPNSKNIDSLIQKFYQGGDNESGRRLLDDLYKPIDPEDKDVEQILHARRLVSRAIESPQSYDLFPGAMRGQVAGAYEKFRSAYEAVANRPTYKTTASVSSPIVQTFKEVSPVVSSAAIQKLPTRLQSIFAESSKPILIQGVPKMSSLSLTSLIRSGLSSVARTSLNTAANQLGRVTGQLAQRYLPGALAVISRNPVASALGAGYIVSSNSGPVGGYIQTGSRLSQRLLESMPYYGEEPETVGSVMRGLGLARNSNRGLRLSVRRRKKNRCLLSTKDMAAFKKVKKLGSMLSGVRSITRRSAPKKTRRGKTCRKMSALQRQYFCKKKRG